MARVMVRLLDEVELRGADINLDDSLDVPEMTSSAKPPIVRRFPGLGTM